MILLLVQLILLGTFLSPSIIFIFLFLFICLDEWGMIIAGIEFMFKANVGAVVVGWKEVGVRPPDNVWTMEVVIVLLPSTWRDYFQGLAFRNPGEADSWR